MAFELCRDGDELDETFVPKEPRFLQALAQVEHAFFRLREEPRIEQRPYAHQSAAFGEFVRLGNLNILTEDETDDLRTAGYKSLLDEFLNVLYCKP